MTTIRFEEAPIQNISSKKIFFSRTLRASCHVRADGGSTYVCIFARNGGSGPRFMDTRRIVQLVAKRETSGCECRRIGRGGTEFLNSFRRRVNRT